MRSTRVARLHNTVTRLSARAGATLGLLVLTHCGAGFKAVDAAGELGQEIDGTIAQTAPAQLCADLSALAPRTPCPEAGKWGDVADAMVAYGAKLSALATKDDVDPEDAISSGLSGASDAKLSKLSADQNGAIAGFAKSVVMALSMAYRADVLADVIPSVNPHLQLVGSLLEGETKLRLQQIEQLESATKEVQSALASLPSPSAASPPPSPSTPPVAAPAAPAAPPVAASDPKLAGWMRDQEAINQVSGQAASVGIALLLQDLQAKKRAYAELRASVAAFCAAHAELTKHAHDLSAKELLPQVIAIAKGAAALRENFKAGPSEAPAGS
jgi:hypothetical protein